MWLEWRCLCYFWRLYFTYDEILFRLMPRAALPGNIPTSRLCRLLSGGGSQEGSRGLLVGMRLSRKADRTQPKSDHT